MRDVDVMLHYKAFGYSSGWQPLRKSAFAHCWAEATVRAASEAVPSLVNLETSMP